MIHLKIHLKIIWDSEFVLDYVQLLYYKCHKINLDRGGSYIDSPDCIKYKEPIINPINKKDNKCKCFQYAVTITLNYEEIKKYPQRITKIKTLINKNKWEGITFPPEKYVWEKIEKNNVTIALNFLYTKKKKYILLMFQNITQTVKSKFFI